VHSDKGKTKSSGRVGTAQPLVETPYLRIESIMFGPDIELGRVLLIDNDLASATRLQALFERAGAVPETLPSGQCDDFLARVYASDVVILDVALPCRSGLDLLTDIRRHVKTQKVPVLMLTAHDSIALRLRTLSMGADDHMAKPPNEAELLLRVAALRRRSTHRGHNITLTEPGSQREHSIASQDIVCVRAARNYTQVHLCDSSLLTNASIGELTEELGPQFIRVHRSWTVNIDHIVDQRWISKSDFIVELDWTDASVVPVSRGLRGDVSDAIRRRRQRTQELGRAGRQGNDCVWMNSVDG
jgi:DNA-binding response OmpR family regulator